MPDKNRRHIPKHTTFTDSNVRDIIAPILEKAGNLNNNLERLVRRYAVYPEQMKELRDRADRLNKAVGFPGYKVTREGAQCFFAACRMVYRTEGVIEVVPSKSPELFQDPLQLTFRFFKKNGRAPFFKLFFKFGNFGGISTSWAEGDAAQCLLAEHEAFAINN